MNVIGLIIGIAILCFGIRNELIWKHRVSHWNKTKGVVIEEAWDTDGRRPKIRFRHKGKAVKFTSMFQSGWFGPRIGNSVPVIYNPKTLVAHHYSCLNRWSGTFSLFFVGLGFIFCALREMSKS